MSAHVTCLATRFCASQEGDPLIPISGDCPKCKQRLLWGEMVRKNKSKLSSVPIEPVSKVETFLSSFSLKILVDHPVQQHSH